MAEWIAVGVLVLIQSVYFWRLSVIHGRQKRIAESILISLKTLQGLNLRVANQEQEMESLTRFQDQLAHLVRDAAKKAVQDDLEQRFQ
jgi:uncharacterized coiled-coil protein SlyX